ncbi:hypothetical protein [Halomonas cerina]|uniref:Uncharacterized protein n=1 Tax=Halomonas cerina TaxID=447424 RepID=A0A839VH19_9GAMM|nr:hypothetical protein [Halomonas cerina]MBB3191977.1 hypothetical protein [Halomonas cerina]
MRDDGGFNAFDHADRVKEGSALEYAERLQNGDGLRDEGDRDRQERQHRPRLRHHRNPDAP